MDLLEWDDSLLVGVKHFDDQHKHLFELLKKTFDACACNQIDELYSTARELTDCTIEYFTEKEKILEQFGYPELSVLIEEHAFFTQILLSWFDTHKLNNVPEQELVSQIGLLSNWLKNIILIYEMKHMHYLSREIAKEKQSPI